MSVAGLKKQFHKASQLLQEKLNGVEGTKLDEEFLIMERKTDITHKLILDLVPKTIGYLQPNPAYRAQLSMLNAVAKIRGKGKTIGYPQTEDILGDCMLHYGSELGAASGFGFALTEMGEALKQVSQAKDSMDVRVNQTFIDPLQSIQDNELKEIRFHLRKLEGRRLDFDFKKRRKGKIANTEIKKALEKFEESKDLAESSMFNLLQKDGVQMQYLSGFISAVLDYHQQSCQILENLRSSLQTRITDASNQPKREFASKSVASTMCYTDIYGLSNWPSGQSSGTEITEALSEKYAPVVVHSPDKAQNPTSNYDSGPPFDQPCCRALYAFQAENQGELCFKGGDIIILTSQVDENWFEGMLNGKSGFFPKNYVKVLVPLP
ncbi:Endophilin-A3 Endophilin-3 SH3 domain-containing GRB2-like protein 3 SH3p13 [Triplophysa tibetana]|uniref:Osteoclast-stimulating factor 1 n=1 Tax=Triplophysa tibetana TaxID=1572043 RepID=A0A5A9MWH9_9TELE|nr:Endophilin-A3 Endophilin-3 SH3 domain-containing GRB2-like protein 3 SH3p13 [Triplophysa tibetana]